MMRDFLARCGHFCYCWRWFFALLLCLLVPLPKLWPYSGRVCSFSSQSTHFLFFNIERAVWFASLLLACYWVSIGDRRVSLSSIWWRRTAGSSSINLMMMRNRCSSWEITTTTWPLSNHQSRKWKCEINNIIQKQTRRPMNCWNKRTKMLPKSHILKCVAFYSETLQKLHILWEMRYKYEVFGTAVEFSIPQSLWNRFHAMLHKRKWIILVP